MCGRYELNATPRDVQEHFAEVLGGAEPPALEPRFNVAPSQPVLAVRSRRDGRAGYQEMTWGYRPAWAKRSWINARAETLFTQPAFRKSAEGRRALVVASGWYEWQPVDGAKQPWYFHLPGQPVFAFAGIWTAQKADEVWHLSVAIVTTEADAVSAPIHHRMPLVLDPAVYARWLDPQVSDAADLLDAGAPAPAAFRVSTHVNDPANDDAGCSRPV